MPRLVNNMKPLSTGAFLLMVDTGLKITHTIDTPDRCIANFDRVLLRLGEWGWRWGGPDEFVVLLEGVGWRGVGV